MRAVAPLSSDMRFVVVSPGVAPGGISVLSIVTSLVLCRNILRIYLAPGNLILQLAVRIDERKGAGISRLRTTDCIAGIVVALRTRHCLHTQELHQVASGEGSVPQPGPRTLS